MPRRFATRNCRRGPNGGRSAWTPLQLSGLILWLDASDASSVAVTSSKATQINDKSGAGNHFVEISAGNGFDYGTTSINGKNTLHGAVARAMVNTGFPAQGDFTIVSVAKVLVTAGYNALFAWGNATPSAYVHVTHPDLYWSGDNDFAEAVAVNDVRTFGIQSVKAATRTVSTWLNGVAGSLNPKNMAGGSAVNTAAGASIINSNSAGAQEGGGFDLGEIVVTSNIMSAADRQSLEAYLRRWGHY